MRPNTFYESRQEDWKQLTHLLNRCQSEIRQLSPEELDTLGRLYRLATSDLALAQRDFPTHKVTLYLNQLVARAHATIYRGEPLAYNRLLRFITEGYPRLYRRTFPYILVAILLFMIPALVIGVAMTVNPDSARWLLPADAQRLIPIMENDELWTEDIGIEDRPYVSSFVMQNNIQVAFLAFGSGMLFGVGSVYVMIFNGQLLGGIMGLAFHYNLGFELCTFVIGHGVVELSVIMMAGGSGLMLGWALLHPGLLRRRDALNQAAQEAVRLLVGCVPLLVVAGLIEGFISPNDSLPWPVKWAVGLGSGILLYGYLLLGGRGKKKEATASSSL
ncbi:MAG: stage II sporulation protein M [Anaerolineae bacterium]|nr:stage II sporulation protein M [Anaerolineae bacterium]